MCMRALGLSECMRPSACPISWAATCTRSVSQTPAGRKTSCNWLLWQRKTVCTSAFSHHSSCWKTRGKIAALERAVLPRVRLLGSCLGPNRANYFHVLPIASSRTRAVPGSRRAALDEPCLTQCNTGPPQRPAHFVPTALSWTIGVGKIPAWKRLLFDLCIPHSQESNSSLLAASSTWI